MDTATKDQLITDENAHDFQQRIGKQLAGGFISLGMALGSRLGLFDLMAKFDMPKTSLEIADAAGYKERYVREWLGIMCTGNIIDLDESGDRYFIPKHRHNVLTCPSQLAIFSWALPMMACNEDNVFKCFQKDGPQGIPYECYPFFHQWRDIRTLKRFEWEPLKETLEVVPGILQKLEKGMLMCDMGTSTGRVPLTLAKQFPQSKFWGLDCSEEAISMAQKTADVRGLTNVIFKVQDICAMPQDWTNMWDLVFMYDVAHDVAHTSTMMKEVLRTLKPGGYFLVVDINLHTRHKDNMSNPAAPMYYTLSLFHCMPVSLNEEGGEGLGNAWGKEKACQMLSEAGFSDVQEVREQGNNIVYLCQKPMS